MHNPYKEEEGGVKNSIFLLYVLYGYSIIAFQILNKD